MFLERPHSAGMATATGQKCFLSENSDLLIFTISVKLEDRKKNPKRGLNWLDP